MTVRGEADIWLLLLPHKKGKGHDLVLLRLTASCLNFGTEEKGVTENRKASACPTFTP